jgi:two-component sensor histidine kinase/ABC-type amino acid transport substrate-binding protein/PAS domain-containing protein
MQRFMILLILLLGSNLCFTQNNTVISDPVNYIRVGVYNNKPLIFMNESSIASGIYADILNYIAIEENWDLEYISGGWQDCLNRLEWNQINILPAIAYSGKRGELFEFSKEPVVVNWGQILIEKSSSIKSFLDLDGKKIGVLNNDIYYIGDKGIINIEQSFDLDFIFVEYKSYNDIYIALENGSIDAGVVNRLYMSSELQNSDIIKTPLIFNPLEIRFALPKDIQFSSILISKIDHHLKALKDDQNSIYYQSIERYLSASISQPKKLSIYFQVIIAILIIAFLVFLILNSYLNIQVKKRAEALNRSEAEFRELYNLFRLTIDNVPDMIWAKNLEYEYMFANNALCRNLLIAKDTDEPIGKTDIFFGERQRQLHPNNLEWHNVDLGCTDTDKAVLESQKEMKFEESGFVKGKLVVLDTRKAPLIDENNQMIGTVGSARFITKEKNLEAEKSKNLQALHERELFNFALFEYNPVETIVVDKEARVIKVNEAVKTRRSHAPKLGDIMYKDYASRYSIDMNAELLNCINENKIRTFPEIVYGNGKIFYITFSPFLSGAIITSRDITGQKKSETQLKALNHVFENLGSDPQININYITAETNRILNGVCSLYNRLDDKDQSLCVWSESNSPSDLPKRDKPDGHICYEATIKGKDKPVIINNLAGTKYEKSDPNVKKYNLKAYLGYPVSLQKKVIGALCIVDVQEREFSDNEVYIISTLAKALSIEEERYRAKQDLQNSLDEKEILLKEIHHRVKNNMQIISSLLNLQSRNIKDDKIMELFKQSQNRVKSMALIHEKLYSDSNFAQIDIASYINTLSNYLFRNFSNLSAEIELEIDTDDIMVDIDTAIPYGLIINELVTNCLKYAFPGDGSGKVQISFKKKGDSHLLTVKDNGVGISKSIDLKKTETLGFQLVKALTDQLHGHLEINHSDGTEVIVRCKSKQK